MALSLRPGIASVGPALPSIIGQFDLSHTTASLLAAIPPLLMGVFALPSPWLTRTFGLHRTLFAALLICGVSVVARSLSSDSIGLIASTFGIGVGIAIAGALIGGFIKSAFNDRLAVVMGIYAAALSLGATLSTAGTGAIVAQMADWRVATGIWSLASFIAIVGWTWTGAKHLDKESDDNCIHRLPISKGKAWLISIHFAFNNILFYSFLTWLIPMYREIGLSASAATGVATAFNLAFTVGSPLVGWLSKGPDRRFWISVSAFLALAGLIPIAIAPATAPFVFVPLCAFGLGGSFTLGMTVLLDNTSSIQQAHSWNAFMMAVGYSFAAAGPITVGYFRDTFGNFDIAMGCLVFIAAAILALARFLGPK